MLCTSTQIKFCGHCHLCLHSYDTVTGACDPNMIATLSLTCCKVMTWLLSLITWGRFTGDWQLEKPQGRNLKCQIFIQHFFKIVLYQLVSWFTIILVPLWSIINIFLIFLFLFVIIFTYLQFLTEFAGFEISFHVVYMWTPHVRWLVELTNQIARRNLVRSHM